VLFGRGFRADLEQIGGDKGAKSIVQAHDHSVLELNLQHSRILFDCDTPDDFLREVLK
jgi:CTP:molybdopterin cytidylyltransferase MocA